MRPQGRARVDPSSPQALGVCDRCFIRYNLVDLHYQHEWTGPRLINTRRRVCQRCMDKPAQQLRTILITADPVPVADPRPELFLVQGGRQLSPWDCIWDCDWDASVTPTLAAGGFDFSDPADSGYVPTV